MPHVVNHPSSDLAPPEADTAALLHTLDILHQEMQRGDWVERLEEKQLHHAYRQSAANLLAYLCLRRHDLRPVQLQLADLGLSSLAGCEAYCINAVENVIAALHRLTGAVQPPDSSDAPDLASGREHLRVHTEALLGSAHDDRPVRIMVTLPDQAADDVSIARDLLAQGMNCARINCAHGDPDSWKRMIDHVRSGADALGRTCKVMMDLAGPKLRTGDIEAEAPVFKVKPERSRFGQVTRPARLWLTAQATEPPQSVLDLQLPWVAVPATWLASLRSGDTLKLRDARGAKRFLRVVECTPQGCWAEVEKTLYLTPGLKLKVMSNGRSKSSGKRRTCKISAVPQREPFIEVHVGEPLVLQLSGIGRQALHDEEGRLKEPPSVVCDVAELYRDARAGQPIWFDDGKIGGRIKAVDSERLEISIEHVTHTRGHAKLRSAKGINLPETDLQLAALTDEDITALEFAVAHADAIELSFANTVADVQAVAGHLRRLGAEHMGVVLKIETRKGFENLPSMLLAGMQFERFGVMIARGDLAVECGFERLAEVQEEILCLCEAAHVPVIWATQVLETLAKKGAPSRAEITDAAMGVRAECVMLNKGPHVLDAIRTLDDLLKRMQGHHVKNRGMMRRLSVAQKAVSSMPGEEN
ncbi:pyruvate kinase [Stutzerimonas stutzeri]|uniref:pyruvate kinase n=1 Tax=Stutzerimonas stutzeri TaxID=316 RepID=UPI00210CD187|nr:pyruvate kinase [Stutzerimonas stutzeri]MCQ4258160.1 pyruvate kinase [Stutzerimonas stutzeri]